MKRYPKMTSQVRKNASKAPNNSKTNLTKFIHDFLTFKIVQNYPFRCHNWNSGSKFDQTQKSQKKQDLFFNFRINSFSYMIFLKVGEKNLKSRF